MEKILGQHSSYPPHPSGERNFTSTIVSKKILPNQKSM